MSNDLQDLQQQVYDLQQRLSAIETQGQVNSRDVATLKSFNVPTIIDAISQHNLRSIMPLYVTHTLLGTLGQTSSNYGQFFVADRAYQITGIAECHGVNSVSGNLSVYKTAPGGVDTLIMQGSLSLATSPTTPQFATLVVNTTSDILTLKRGDRLRCGAGGNLANLIDLVVMVYLRPI